MNTRTVFRCGGTILNSKVILTTAHCVIYINENRKYTTDEINVKASIYDASRHGNLDPRAVTVPINEVIVHPGYASQTTP